jgi:hypothetical protein
MDSFHGYITQGRGVIGFFLRRLFFFKAKCYNWKATNTGSGKIKPLKRVHLGSPGVGPCHSSLGSGLAWYLKTLLNTTQDAALLLLPMGRSLLSTEPPAL